MKIQTDLIWPIGAEPVTHISKDLFAGSSDAPSLISDQADFAIPKSDSKDPVGDTKNVSKPYGGPDMPDNNKPAPLLADPVSAQETFGFLSSDAPSLISDQADFTIPKSDPKDPVGDTKNVSRPYGGPDMPDKNKPAPLLADPVSAQETVGSLANNNLYPQKPGLLRMFTNRFMVVV